MMFPFEPTRHKNTTQGLIPLFGGVQQTINGIGDSQGFVILHTQTFLHVKGWKSINHHKPFLSTRNVDPAKMPWRCHLIATEIVGERSEVRASNRFLPRHDNVGLSPGKVVNLGS